MPPHLSPGGGVPAEAGLGPTGLASRWLSGPRLAMEWPQWPKILCVHTVHVPHCRASTTAAGTLRDRDMCDTSL